MKTATDFQIVIYISMTRNNCIILYNSLKIMLSLYFYLLHLVHGPLRKLATEGAVTCPAATMGQGIVLLPTEFTHPSVAQDSQRGWGPWQRLTALVTLGHKHAHSRACSSTDGNSANSHVFRALRVGHSKTPNLRHPMESCQQCPHVRTLCFPL